jgi:putative ABC transport system permease protein
MTNFVAHASARRTFSLVLVGAASAIALLLGTVGLYSVIAYVAALRTPEMGIRIALGAEPRAISRMVSRQGTTLAIFGIAIGLAGAVALTRFLATLLFEVSPTDPVILIGAAALLLAVAATASWLPARRAAAVDPAAALKME